MSIESQIRPEAIKIPRAEIVRPAKDRWWAQVDNFEGLSGAQKGDALKALGTIHYCHQVNVPNVEIHEIPKTIARYLAGTDSVIIGHGPLGERAGGIPAIGRDSKYQGWHGMTDNDGELTILSTHSRDTIEKAISLGLQGASMKDLVIRNWSTWLTHIPWPGWKTPSWNIGKPEIEMNRFKNCEYTYWRQDRYPSYDVHYISGPDPVNEFLAMYGNRYSNIFGARFLACFINSDGSLEQRIWQPVKPEKNCQQHLIKLLRENELLKIPWVIPETVKMAVDVVRYSAVTKKQAKIDPLIVDKLRENLSRQAKKVKELKGAEWLIDKANKKLGTAIHRAKLSDPESGGKKILETLAKVGWFEAIYS